MGRIDQGMRRGDRRRVRVFDPFIWMVDEAGRYGSPILPAIACHEGRVIANTRVTVDRGGEGQMAKN